jgi:hypothetical protein
MGKVAALGAVAVDDGRPTAINWSGGWEWPCCGRRAALGESGGHRELGALAAALGRAGEQKELAADIRFTYQCVISPPSEISTT